MSILSKILILLQIYKQVLLSDDSELGDGGSEAAEGEAQYDILPGLDF